MLGFYQNFPRQAHNLLHFTVAASRRKLQQVLTQTLHKLNSETFGIEEVAHPSIKCCTVILEFGIAEANVFNYLDEEQTRRTLRALQKEPFQVMDFFCVIRYYKTRKQKRSALKFDYYMLRFTFGRKSADVQVFHERGPRHASPEEIADFITDKVNEQSSRRILRH